MSEFLAPIQIVADSAQEIYRQLLIGLFSGQEVGSIRSEKSVGSCWGTRDRPTKELRYATLVLRNSRDRLIDSPVASPDKIYPRTLLSTLSDEMDVEALAFYDPRAKEFSDDGKTIPTNYGYRVRHFNQKNQIDQVIEQFKKDLYTRRAVIHIHNVDDHEKRYDPCINAIHFLIRDGRLECHTFWRSENGLILFPVNLFEFTMLQELIASELDIEPGLYVHTVTSLHYYVDDQEKFDAILTNLNRAKKPAEMPPMTKNSLDQVAILRRVEKKMRLNGVGGLPKEYKMLTEYWKAYAKTILSAIERKKEKVESLHQKLKAV